MPRATRGTFDYDSAPKQGAFLYPDGYYLAEVESHEQVRSQSGNVGYLVVARIRDVGPATDEYEGNPLFLRYYVGHEDDPDAEDPKTWHDGESKQAFPSAKGSRFSISNLISFLRATGLTKGEGRGIHPLDLLDEVDNAIFGVHMTTRTNKKSGEAEQNYRYFAKGEREPGLIGAAAQPQGRTRAHTEAPTPIAARRAAPQAAVEEVEEELPPRRARAR